MNWLKSNLMNWAESSTYRYKQLPNSPRGQADHSYRNSTRMICLILSLYEVWEVGIEGAFLKRYEQAFASINLVVACIFAAKLVYAISMGIFTGRKIKPSSIIEWCIIIGDVASALIFMINYFSRFPHCRLLQFLRLIHWARVFNFISQLEQDLDIKYKVARSAKLAMITLFFIHYPACVFCYMGSGEHRSESWMGLAKENITTMGISKSYLLSIYFATTTASTVGYGEFHPVETWEYVFCVLYMLAGIIYLSYSFPAIGNLFTEQNDPPRGKSNALTGSLRKSNPTSDAQISSPSRPSYSHLIDVPDFDSQTMLGRGIINLGGLGYLNSILQCLSHTDLLHRQSQYPIFNDQVDRAFEELVRKLCSSDTTPVDPKEFVEELGNRCEMPDDCFKFLGVLFENFGTNMKGKVNNIFQFHIEESCECFHCKKELDSEKRPIKWISMEKDFFDARAKQRMIPDSLESYLGAYFKPQSTKSEMKCDSCQTKAFVTRKVKIVGAPKILILHLGIKKNGVKKVVVNHLAIPEALDLKKYNAIDDNSPEDALYHLYAVIENDMSHYKAYIKEQESRLWLEYDDCEVRPCGYAAGKKFPYLIFYRRQS